MRRRSQGDGGGGAAEAYKGRGGERGGGRRRDRGDGRGEGVRETRLGGPRWTVALTLARLWRVRPAHTPHSMTQGPSVLSALGVCVMRPRCKHGVSGCSSATKLSRGGIIDKELVTDLFYSNVNETRDFCVVHLLKLGRVIFLKTKLTSLLYHIRLTHTMNRL
jgi:hypothetical protein